MNQFGELYSKYYDLLYADKDYAGEVDYVNGLIAANRKDAKTLLDMGCGTGKHAELFCDKGYTVHGVDLSEEMLGIAESRRTGKEDNLTFSKSDITKLKLDKKFDAVVSLFHVMSYQNSNDELLQAFQVAREHLKEGGIFIFDFWYGPAVLTDLPTTRVKRLENNEIKVTRFVEPVLHVEKNVVDVHYDLFIENKKTTQIIEKKELHKMRYLFDTELELICEKVGLTIVEKYEWMTHDKPNFNSWNVLWILKND
ncbi:class I SAM-dependent methyltransferase [Sulfurimonas sp. HSL-1716]|uniref:class I SAM-dependent DNA methyltransferase n=1 Tax=Hydrocurvibacter sulfurireducens TaxID=3131937 RepID=UPI0031F74491